MMPLNPQLAGLLAYMPVHPFRLLSDLIYDYVNTKTNFSNI